MWAQDVSIEHGRFQKGDNPAWSAFAWDDSAWREVTFHQPWEELGLDSANGIGWYRIHVVIPSSLKKGVVEAVMLEAEYLDDETVLDLLPNISVDMRSGILERRTGKAGRHGGSASERRV